MSRIKPITIVKGAATIAASPRTLFFSKAADIVKKVRTIAGPNTTRNGYAIMSPMAVKTLTIL